MPTPVVFIHGLWLHADSWKPWVELFRAAGYDPIAPGWPGDSATVAESNAHPERIANVGIDDVVEHYATIIRKLPSKPIVVGHSFGGLVAQKLLGMGLASAAIALDPAQIRGVLPLPLAQLKSAFPVLGNPFNYKRAISQTPKQFRFGFGNAVSATESDALHAKYHIPAPGRPLFEAAFANFLPNTAAKVNTRSGVCELLAEYRGESEHEGAARPIAHHRRRKGSHGSGSRVARRVQVVSQGAECDRVSGISGPRSFAHGRQWLEGSRECVADVAESERTLIGCVNPGLAARG